ncbi:MULTISPECIES: putative O-glycosylation ligase, exosortase A system-associated [unclassified Janthinobacterium]|uniref:putative O-glycosylation ligase, exosortase A system-associated n=1 Tax=unclassified Janthinobacterium TaxID=2610881 RepID=UPI0003448D50|nr:MULTISPECIES: putative O-glycosylation ligase, exosortase A system-associated [unclassified Janthinobacterium]MEC5161294.1 putative inorganic carbon (HCO3(-)) transporter [Janthinobacterium sp. CG_S6]
MRDLLITLTILASLPFILKRPAIGGLMWVWVSVMNPHSQGWGYATQLPFAFLIAVATMLSMLVSREPKSLPLTPVSLALLAFVLWMNVTTPLALLQASSWVQWNKVMKIMLMTCVILMVIRSRRDIQRLVWVLVFSLGYYGVKGGLFTLRGGGTERVWGPEGSFIGDNNAFALALIITLPLMYYLYQNSTRKWTRAALLAVMALSALSALGSYSRGALVAIVAMGLFMWYKSGRKLAFGSLVLLCAPVFFLFMPQRWAERMDTIGDYHADGSALGRLNAWRMAYNLACDRFFGGGFEVSHASVFSRYAPNPADVHAAHSIYFQALGEHGFVGLGLYLLLGWLTWRSAAWTIRQARGRAELAWAGGLAVMIQASMIGFAVGGAFLSLLYFDLPYYLMAAVVATRVLVEQQLRSGAPRAAPLRTAPATTPQQARRVRAAALDKARRGAGAEP